MRAGALWSAGAFTMWGLLPLYLRLVRSVGALELIMHRIVWSAAFVLAVLAVTRRWTWMRQAVRSKAVMIRFAASAAGLSLNWLVFVWAVNAGHNVDASLGYFINPILSVALGALLLRERLSGVRWLAVGWAALGLVWLTVQFGRVPWIGLALAGSFAAYGLLRKTARLGALEGLALETLLLCPLAVAYLGWLAANGRSEFVNEGPRLKLLVLLAGPVTALPLLFFAAGARRIPLSSLGLLQYIGPTLQLLIGVLVWHEPFGGDRLIGYALIWAAFLLASAESLWRSRRSFTARESRADLQPARSAPAREDGRYARPDAGCP